MSLSDVTSAALEVHLSRGLVFFFSDFYDLILKYLRVVSVRTAPMPSKRVITITDISQQDELKGYNTSRFASVG